MKYIFIFLLAFPLFSEEVSFRLYNDDGVVEANGFCIFQGFSFSLRKIDGVWKEIPVEYKIRARSGCSKKILTESAELRINVSCIIQENIVKNETLHFAYGNCKAERSWNEEKEAEFRRILER